MEYTQVYQSHPLSIPYEATPQMESVMIELSVPLEDEKIVETSEPPKKDEKKEKKEKLELDIIIRERIEQSWNVARIATECIPLGWEDVFRDEKYQLLHASRILEAEEKCGRSWFPLKEDLFRSYDMCRLSDVEVVIIGQDPYPGVINSLPRATGMAFSQRPGEPISSSLMNVFKELTNTVRGFIPPKNGDLTKWARQGVFLINTCLTIDSEKTSSKKGARDHLKSGIWSNFVIATLNKIVSVNPNVIFVMWGEYAKKFGNKIKGINMKLMAAHPSGMSSKGFLGCDHFNRINEILRLRGKYIDWNTS